MKRLPLEPSEPRPPRRRYPLNGKAEFMSIIQARRDDWVPENPRIHVGGWIGAFVVMAVIYIGVAAIIGHFVNGNGSPYLLSI
jgi:hypothetical protein